MLCVFVALAGLATAAVLVAPLASADPSVGHEAKVYTQIPRMLCAIGSDDSDAGVGPNVVCQGKFVQAPGDDDDQALVTASGRFSYRTANIATGYDHPPFETLVADQTYHLQGWTILAGDDGVRFTNDDTGHGIFIGSDTTVDPY